MSLTGFATHETGSSHDTFSFATSEFANFAALLGDAKTANGAAVITAGNGDVLTLVGVTAATLAGLSADFTFHA